MDVLETARELIELDSVTSAPNTDVAHYLQTRLQELGFSVQATDYTDLQGTKKINLAARRNPPAQNTSSEKSANLGIGFFCHADVVSVQGWNCPHSGPFQGNIHADRMWGRGACDMKGPTAAALAAISQLPVEQQTAPIYFFATGDEECGMSGARLIADESSYFAEMVAKGSVGIICEPTELQVVNSHKGGCRVDVSSQGVAAHSSTAEGKNANWPLIPFLAYLQQVASRCETDARLLNSAFSPPTLSMNLIIENEPCAPNITVGCATCRVFFRPMPDTDWQGLQQEIADTARQMQLSVVCPPPFLPLHTSADRPLVKTALELLGLSTPQAVAYATDGCCFEALPDVIVLGPGSIAQAHRPDEWIAIEQLQRAVEVYQKLLRHYAWAA